MPAGPLYLLLLEMISLKPADWSLSNTSMKWMLIFQPNNKRPYLITIHNSDSTMRRFLFSLLLLTLVFNASSQNSTSKANYQLASRFSDKKINKMVFSTSVDPHWLKKSDRFWYVYETPNGKNWYIVDPVRNEKKHMFDNARMAAEITKIVKDPFDEQHLEIDSLRFVKDENWIQFQVTSSIDIVVKDTSAKKNAPPRKEKKKFYFEYNLQNGQLVELSDFTRPKRNHRWASISPDGNTIVFARKFNLYFMDRANYEKAL